ncbi:hypothetical protein GCM10027515_30580 [Schumannella luteola]|uniref:NERD domain-containing protein n=1 Tax=Schumannella luteola TaxID=472059 RepID=A0A852YD99_9MICO|nr:hypothetical protein [Schumannella luteola]
MSDLQQRVPGQSLIEKLLSEWDAGRIRLDPTTGRVEIADASISWFQGVLGERVSGRLLNQIAVHPGVTVLHSVPFGSRSSDIDHVVITAAGVFVINTKHHEGASVWAGGWGVKVNNYSQKSYIPSLVDHARRTEERLSRAAGFAVPVIGVLCLVGVHPAEFRQTAAPGDATTPPLAVTTVERLLHDITARRREMSDEQLDRVTQAALLPETWHDAPSASRPGAHLGAEFDALYAEIGGAVLIRRAELKQEGRERAAVARETARVGAGRGGSRPPARSGPPPRRASERGIPRPEPATAAVPLTPETTWTQGAAGLALWPLLFVAARGITSAVEAIGVDSVISTLGLVALWLLLAASPVLFAVADLRQLRDRGIDLRSGANALVLLGPLAHLISRHVRLHRRGRTGAGALIAHLVGGVVAVPILLGMWMASTFAF